MLTQSQFVSRYGFMKPNATHQTILKKFAAARQLVRQRSRFGKVQTHTIFIDKSVEVGEDERRIYLTGLNGETILITAHENDRVYDIIRMVRRDRNDISTDAVVNLRNETGEIINIHSTIHDANIKNDDILNYTITHLTKTLLETNDKIVSEPIGQDMSIIKAVFHSNQARLLRVRNESQVLGPTQIKIDITNYIKGPTLSVGAIVGLEGAGMGAAAAYASAFSASPASLQQIGYLSIQTKADLTRLQYFYVQSMHITFSNILVLNCTGNWWGLDPETSDFVEYKGCCIVLMYDVSSYNIEEWSTPIYSEVEIMHPEVTEYVRWEVSDDGMTMVKKKISKSSTEGVAADDAAAAGAGDAGDAAAELVQEQCIYELYDVTLQVDIDTNKQSVTITRKTTLITDEKWLTLSDDGAYLYSEKLQIVDGALVSRKLHRIVRTMNMNETNDIPLTIQTDDLPVILTNQVLRSIAFGNVLAAVTEDSLFIYDISSETIQHLCSIPIIGRNVWKMMIDGLTNTLVVSYIQQQEFFQHVLICIRLSPIFSRENVCIDYFPVTPSKDIFREWLSPSCWYVDKGMQHIYVDSTVDQINQHSLWRAATTDTGTQVVKVTKPFELGSVVVFENGNIIPEAQAPAVLHGAQQEE